MNVKKYLPHLIIFAIVIVACSFWVFNYYRSYTPRSKAAEIVKRPIVSGQKVPGYVEVKIAKSTPSKKVSISNVAIFSPLQNQPALPITGNWQGKTVSVVPDDRFFPQYNYFTYYGITSFDTLKNNQMIIGGMDGFAFKSPTDTEWQNLVLIPANQFGMSGNIIGKSMQIFDQQNTDTYLLGIRGLLRLQTDGTLSEIIDPSLPYGHMDSLNDIGTYGNRGLVTFIEGGQQSLQSYLYYTEDGQLRKWALPHLDPTTWSDNIFGIFNDPDDSTHQTFYALVTHCVQVPCNQNWQNYLYQFHFSIDPNIPLDVTQLGTLSTVGQGGNIYQMTMKHMISQPTQKIVYGITGNQPYRRSGVVSALRNFNPLAQNNVIHGIPANIQYGDPGQSTLDTTTQDTFWFSGTMNTVTTIFTAKNFETSDTINITSMTNQEKQMLANPYALTVSSDPNGTIYLGHQYLHGQFRNGLVSNFSNPSPTPTPIPYSACDTDINHSGVTDITDFSILRGEFGRACLQTDQYCADIDHSGIVDITDFSILRSFFGEICEANLTPTPTSTPIPTETPIPTPTVVPSKRVFVTSIYYRGNLSGLSGADSECQVRASAASLGGTWKAWLSDGYTDAKDRLTHSIYPYKLLTGTVIANNWTDLTDGSISAPINVNEFGAYSSPLKVWTHTTRSGYKNGNYSVQHCQQWQSSSPALEGDVGSISNTNYQWTEDTYTVHCDTAYPPGLYCFEQ